MKHLNDKEYKDLLKSVKPDFDKSQLWEEIDAQIEDKEKKEKRGFFWLFFFGMGLVFLIGGIMYFFSTEVTNIGQEKTELVIAQQENQELLKSKDQISNAPEKNKETRVGVVSEQKEKGNLSEDKMVNNNQQLGVNDIPSRLSPTVSESPEKNNQSIVISKKENNTPSTNSIPFSTKNNTVNIPSKGIIEGNSQNSSLRLLPLIPTSKPLLISEKETIEISLLSPQENSFDDNAFRRPKKKKAGLLISTQIGSSNVRSSADSPSAQSVLDNSNQYISSRYRLGLTLAGEFPIGKNLDLQVGLQMTRYTERFNYERKEQIEAEVPSDSAFYFTYGDGTTIYYPGQLTQTTNYDYEIQQYNQHYTIGLLLGAQYRRPLGKDFSLLSSINTTLSPISWSTGKVLNLDEEIVSVAEDDFTRRSFNWSVGLGLGVEWTIAPNWSLRSDLQWRTDLLSRRQENSLQIRYQSLNLSLGILRRF